jgi:hypothetical protein
MKMPCRLSSQAARIRCWGSVSNFFRRERNNGTGPSMFSGRAHDPLQDDARRVDRPFRPSMSTTSGVPGRARLRLRISR